MSEKVQSKKKGNIFIITGASGVKPKLALKKFNNFLKQKGKQQLKVVDLEEKLVSLALEDPICCRSQAFQREIKIQEPIIAVASLPHLLRKKLWEQAMDEVCNEVLNVIKTGRNVAMVLHAVHFNPNSTELVPIVDSRKIEVVKPTCVINLIDDMDDICRWLTKPRGVFDKSSYPEGQFEQMERSVKNLSSILIWRQAEAGSSVHIAGLIGSIPHFTIATKHSCRLLEHVSKSNPYCVYISHPITEARQRAASGNQKLFDAWSKEVGNLADHLSKDLAVWEPTTIDELRIHTKKVKLSSGSGQTTKEVEFAFPRFLPRWPFQRSDEILWTTPPTHVEEILDPASFFTEKDIAIIMEATTWEDLETKLGKDKSAQLRSISGQLGNLKFLIGQQINARDRTLIGQCPILVVYRPLFNGNPATGVLRELETHQMLVELKHFSGDLKPAVFVLENSEDERLVCRNTLKEFCAPDGRWSRYVCDDKGISLSEERSQEIANFLTKNSLKAGHIVNTMQTASQRLQFRWGESPQSRSTLNGMGKGTTAWMGFVNDRINDLDNKIQEKMQYKVVLKTYKKGIVFRSRDVSIIDFANEVINKVKKRLT